MEAALTAKGEKNAQARLTEADVLDIRWWAQNGSKQAQLAEEFGISQQHVSAIVRRAKWRHI